MKTSSPDSGITPLRFIPKNPGEVQTGDGNRKELNGLKEGTALRTRLRRGKDKVKP